MQISIAAVPKIAPKWKCPKCLLTEWINCGIVTQRVSTQQYNGIIRDKKTETYPKEILYKSIHLYEKITKV